MYMLNDVFPAGRPGPVLATVFLGANDATLAQYHCRQHVPLSEYTANLRLIVRHIQSLGTPAAPVQVLLIAPPPIDEAARLVFQAKKYPLSPTGINERTLELSGVYARACVDLAAEMGCVTVRARGGCWMTVVARELALSHACGTGLVDSACGLG
jgi:lysophospholipase L1-like esterase